MDARRAPRPAFAFLASVAVAIAVAGCAQPAIAPTAPAPPPAPVAPKAEPAPTPPPKPEKPAAPEGKRVERGPVSFYAHEFAGRKTASGETFDPEALTMAHRTLPFGTRVRVTNTENGRSVEVVVNDRGPAIASRIADLSLAAARRLDAIADGVVEAVLEVLALPSAR
jgi:rare lipoprotein A